MNKYYGIVLVRSESNRLPQKCFLSFGKVSVIEHIILRCKFYKINPIICTTESNKDNRIITIAKKHKVRFFRGSAQNKILRISKCCKKFNIKFFHTIDADDPFFCGTEVKRSLDFLMRNKLDIVEPTPSSKNGSGLVGYSVKSKSFNLISDSINKRTNTEMMWNFFKNKKLKILQLKDLKKNIIHKVRLTLDYHEDYIFLESIRLLLGNFASRTSIKYLLNNNKEIKKINFFRNRAWKVNQLNFIK
jgi:spore coat polysaccharide biosynthesis protein SpsF (cytidylyltransferase family)